MGQDPSTSCTQCTRNHHRNSSSTLVFFSKPKTTRCLWENVIAVKLWSSHICHRNGSSRSNRLPSQQSKQSKTDAFGLFLKAGPTTTSAGCGTLKTGASHDKSGGAIRFLPGTAGVATQDLILDTASTAKPRWHLDSLPRKAQARSSRRLAPTHLPELRRPGFYPRSRRARHLVLLCPLAVLYAWMA